MRGLINKLFLCNTKIREIYRERTRTRAFTSIHLHIFLFARGYVGRYLGSKNSSSFKFLRSIKSIFCAQ